MRAGVLWSEAKSSPLGIAASLRQEMDDMFMHGFPKGTTTYDFIPIEEKP